MYLASKLSKFEVKDWKNRTPEQKSWWDLYVKDLDTEVLEDICHQVGLGHKKVKNVDRPHDL